MSRELLAVKDGVTYAAIVDDDVFELGKGYKWRVQFLGGSRKPYFYTRLSRERANTVLHHFVIGKPQKGMVTDHIDRDTLNNQRSNLRHCTIRQNAMNVGPQRNNTSGYKGVTWHKKDKKWQASIGLNGKITYLGSYKTAEEAHRAYCAIGEKVYGEFFSSKA